MPKVTGASTSGCRRHAQAAPRRKEAVTAARSSSVRASGVGRPPGPGAPGELGEPRWSNVRRVARVIAHGQRPALVDALQQRAQLDVLLQLLSLGRLVGYLELIGVHDEPAGSLLSRDI